MKGTIPMYAGATDKGLIRVNNEDSYAVLSASDLLISPEDADFPCALVVADGMGGHRKGELASRIAVDYTVSRLLGKVSLDSPPEEIAALLRDTVEKANVKVYLGSLESEDREGMGTTLTVSVVLSEHVVTAHIGDTRAYLLRDGALQRITVDHTLVQELVAAGDLDPEEAIHHPKRNILTRALGVPEYMQAETYTVPLKRGDRILLCSDGLHGYIPDNEIRQVLRKERDPATAARRLIDIANAAGGEDNVTVALCHV